MTLGDITEGWMGGKFRVTDPVIPFGSPSLELNDELSILPVFHVGALRYDTNRIPLTRRLCILWVRSYQIVESGREIFDVTAGRGLIINNLELRTGPVDRLILLQDMVKDAAVTPLTDVIFKRELKITKDLPGDDISAITCSGSEDKLITFNTPRFRQIFPVVPAPLLQGFTVKKCDPFTGRLLLTGGLTGALTGCHQ